MKKILSIVLTLVITFGSFGFAFAGGIIADAAVFETENGVEVEMAPFLYKSAAYQMEFPSHKGYEIKEKSVAEIDAMLDNEFSFDNFANQRDKKIAVTEDFRAEGLERILYKCPACKTENNMVGSGVSLTCKECGKEYFMDKFGQMNAVAGNTEYPHIPDWYRWERECVKEELKNGTYKLDCDVQIGIMTDFKAIYMVGDGHLTHDENGFTLTGCDGQLTYRQSPLANYGLYADYYWYEIGDVICIGDKKRLYYCFPKTSQNVAKARIAAEELFIMKKG